MPARKVAEILGDSPNLTALAATAQRTAELQRVYLQAVPAELSKTSHVCWARAGVLSMAAGSGAIAAKLRQLAPRILERFRQQGFEFNAMRVEVQVGLNQHALRKTEAKPLSEKALKSIRDAALELPESPLKSVLVRLGRIDRGTQSVRSKT